MSTSNPSNSPKPAKPPISPSPYLHPLGAAPSAPALRGWPILRLGFRPFYILSALLACLSVPMWLAVFLGYMPWRHELPGLLWHGHEMLFGFAGSVVAGFLLTAVRAWTGHDTPRGAVLGVLAALWIGARVAFFVAPYWVFAALDIALLPAVALLLMRVLINAKNKRNMPLMAVMLLMALSNILFHVWATQGQESLALRALYAQLGLVIMVVSVITGRVLPLFTKNVTPGLVIQTPRRMEMALLATTAAALLLWVCDAYSYFVFAVSALAAVLHAMRLLRWSPWVTLKRPILWVLHLSYAWLPIGFSLLALSSLGAVPVSLALHAFAVGVIGGLIIGMMTRTARGHTGRPLKASGVEVAAYTLVLLAAFLRVIPALIEPSWYLRALEISAALWALGFALYLVLYTPWLCSSRLDGKDG